MKMHCPHGPHGPPTQKPYILLGFSWSVTPGLWSVWSVGKQNTQMHDLTLMRYRSTDFTPESFVSTVEAVARALPNLETATIKSWQRAQSSAAKMKARVVVTGLHMWRKWQPDHGPFLKFAARHVWAFKGKPVPDQGSYAELRRLLPCPSAGLSTPEVAVDCSSATRYVR